MVTKKAVKKAPAKKVASKKAPARKTVTSVLKEFEDFKQRVVDTTWNWDDGCKAGKSEFLKDLGLKSPPREAVYYVRIVVSVPGDTDEYEVPSELRQKFVTMSNKVLDFEFEQFND